MNVRLISCTMDVTSPEREDYKKPEELIVYEARVSNPANQNNKLTAVDLIKFLIREKHWSPFELVDFTVEVKTSRAIAQQILRHRSFCFQEFSQRYARVTEIEPVQLRKQAEKNRQSSTEEFDPMIVMKNPVEQWECSANSAIQSYIEEGQALYNSLIDAGAAKECARFILPLTTGTTLFVKGSVRSWIHYLQIRCDEHTQLEHRQIALAIRDEIFVNLFPHIYSALWL